MGPRPEIQKFLAQVRWIFLAAGGFSLVVNLLMLVPSLYMLQVYDRVLTSRNFDTLLLLSILVLGLYLVLALVEWVRSQLLVNAGAELDGLMSPRVFESYVRLRAQDKGSAADAAFTDASTLRNFLTGNALFALFDLPWAPVFLIVLYLIHPALAGVALIGAVLLLLLAWIGERTTRASITQAGSMQGSILQSVYGYGRNHEAILAMGMLARLRARWLEQQHRLVALQAATSRKAGALAAASRFIRMAQQTAILGVGALYVIKGDISPGAMIAASILMGRALAPLDLAIASWRQFFAARAAYERLGRLLARVPPLRPALELPPPEGNIAIESITVVPPGAPVPALAAIEFPIKAGMAVGVVGHSGSGKSCLARVLAGVWKPARGVVRLDGAALEDWDPQRLGAFVGYLPQAVELLDGTVAQNIARFGEQDAEKVVAAARTAGIHDLILRLPNGYETQVGLDGANLSGGQRQRIGLARAVYGQPRVIVLDEPNANLDEQGEAALVAALQEFKAWKSTVVIITHRRPILAATDGLLVLKEGRLVVYGPTQKVLQQTSAPVAPPPQPKPVQQT